MNVDLVGDILAEKFGLRVQQAARNVKVWEQQCESRVADEAAGLTASVGKKC